MESKPVPDEQMDAPSAEPNDDQQETPTSNPESSVGPSNGLMGDLAVFLAEIPDPATSPSPSSQHEVDYPEKIKRLKKRIDSLRHDASEARKAFKYVEKIVEKTVLTEGQREELGKLWQEEFEGFEKKLHHSREVAIQASGTIEDFLKAIVPYLEDQERQVEEKVKLLADYRDTVSSGKQRAYDISKSFDNMQERIKFFRAKFIKYTTETDNKMATAMDKLQEDIDQLSNTWKTVSWSFLVLFKGIQDELQVEVNEDVPPSPQDLKGGQSIRELRQELEDYFCRRLEAADQNVAVTKKIDELIQIANDFSVIWNLIEDNVTEIETKLSFMASPLAQVFYNRLSRLPEQYRGLKEALDSYAIALSERSVAETAAAECSEHSAETAAAEGPGRPGRDQRPPLLDRIKTMLHVKERRPSRRPR